MIASDRISAFDHVLPQGISCKGQVLSQIAAKFLDATADIVPNWLEATPDPWFLSVFEPFKVEMVIRGYLTGHAWRIPFWQTNDLWCSDAEGMVENQKFDELILPTTRLVMMKTFLEKKLAQGLVNETDYIIEKYTHEAFPEEQKWLLRKVVLVDTKYEFGKDSNGQITLIDEIHTPDSHDISTRIWIN